MENSESRCIFASLNNTKTNTMTNLNSVAQAVSFETENNTEKAIKIWHNNLTPTQRIELRNEIGADKYSQISRMYNACINHIANNLEKYS